MARKLGSTPWPIIVGAGIIGLAIWAASKSKATSDTGPLPRDGGTLFRWEARNFGLEQESGGAARPIIYSGRNVTEVLDQIRAEFGSSEGWTLRPVA